MSYDLGPVFVVWLDGMREGPLPVVDLGIRDDGIHCFEAYVKPRGLQLPQWVEVKDLPAHSQLKVRTPPPAD